MNWSDRESGKFFSELLQKDLDALYCYDEYEMTENFTVMGKQIAVHDEWISKALKNFRQKTGYHFDVVFFRYDRERDCCLYETGPEYCTLP